MEFELIRFNNYILTVYDLLLAVGTSLLWILIAWVVLRHVLPRAYAAQEAPEDSRRKITRLVWSMVIIVGLIILILSLGLDFAIYNAEEDRFTLYVHTIFQGLLILQTARLADWLIYRFVIGRYQDPGQKEMV